MADIDLKDIAGKVIAAVPDDLKASAMQLVGRATDADSGLLSFVPDQYRRLITYGLFGLSMLGSGGVGSFLTPEKPAEVPAAVVEEFEAAAKRMEELSGKRHKMIIRDKATGKILSEREF